MTCPTARTATIDPYYPGTGPRGFCSFLPQTTCIGTFSSTPTTGAGRSLPTEKPTIPTATPRCSNLKAPQSGQSHRSPYPHGRGHPPGRDPVTAGSPELRRRVQHGYLRVGAGRSRVGRQWDVAWREASSHAVPAAVWRALSGGARGDTGRGSGRRKYAVWVGWNLDPGDALYHGKSCARTPCPTGQDIANTVEGLIGTAPGQERLGHHPDAWRLEVVPRCDSRSFSIPRPVIWRRTASRSPRSKTRSAGSTGCTRGRSFRSSRGKREVRTDSHRRSLQWLSGAAVAARLSLGGVQQRRGPSSASKTMVGFHIPALLFVGSGGPSRFVGANTARARLPIRRKSLSSVTPRRGYWERCVTRSDAFGGQPEAD